MNKMFYNILTTIIMLMSCQVYAVSLSGNIGATSNYLWRGVTQSDAKPAVQGGMDYTEGDFYIGAWTSNTDFNNETTYELDFYTGYKKAVANGFSYDFGYLLYSYPQANNKIDFGELYLYLSWEWIELGYAQFIHADDDVALTGLDDKDYKYITADISFPITEKLYMNIHYGFSDGDVVQSWYSTATDRVTSYSDYSIALTATTDLGDVSFAVAETDLPGDDTKLVLGFNYSFNLL